MACDKSGAQSEAFACYDMPVLLSWRRRKVKKLARRVSGRAPWLFFPYLQRLEHLRFQLESSLALCVHSPTPVQMLTPEVEALLLQWTLADFLSRKPPSTVVCCHADESLVSVLAKFARSNILSGPLFDREDSRYLGFLDLLDIAAWILLQVGAEPKQLPYYLQQAGDRLATTSAGEIHLRGDARLVYQAYSNASLLEVVREGFLRPAVAGRPCHRLAVFHYPDPSQADPSDAAAGLQITHIVSQSDVVAFLHRHATGLAPALFSSSLEALGLVAKPVVAVPSSMPALHAFQAVLRSGVGCAGVVELHSHGALVGQLSTSDLRGLLPQHFELLGLPVLDFLARSLGGWEPTPTALTQSFGVKSPRKQTREVSVATCSMQTTLGEVLERIVEGHLHRVFVVDESGRPLAVLSLTDMLQLLVGGPSLRGAEG